jgi:hypothetical protein
MNNPSKAEMISDRSDECLPAGKHEWSVEQKLNLVLEAGNTTIFDQRKNQNLQQKSKILSLPLPSLNF